NDTVYGDPTLAYVIVTLAFAAIIAGFESTKVFEASRNLSLGSIIQIEIAAQIGGLLCMLGWIVSIDRSIWALVIGALGSMLVRVTLSHAWLSGVANGWQWDRSAFWEIIHFGKWMFISSVLFFLVSNGDRLLLGGLVNSTVLGVYVIAF